MKETNETGPEKDFQRQRTQLLQQLASMNEMLDAEILALKDNTNVLNNQLRKQFYDAVVKNGMPVKLAARILGFLEFNFPVPRQLQADPEILTQLNTLMERSADAMVKQYNIFVRDYPDNCDLVFSNYIQSSTQRGRPSGV